MRQRRISEVRAGVLKPRDLIREVLQSRFGPAAVPAAYERYGKLVRDVGMKAE